MVTLFYGKISSIDYKSGTADITLQERENQVIQGVPFLSMVYEMPKPGEIVAVLFEELDGQIAKGVILGKLFIDDNKPAESGSDIFYKRFTDNSSIKYDPATEELEIRVKKVKVNEIEYETASQRG